jgi:hypothetical protein
MIAAFGMLVWTLLHRVEGRISALRILIVSATASYLAAVLVNATRITIAMWLGAHPMALSALSADDVHRIEGIVVYFGGLLGLHRVVQRLDRASVPVRWWSCAALPLAAYYAVTLAIPLANGAASSGAPFLDHALVVLVVPAVMIILACFVHAALLCLYSRMCDRGRYTSGHPRLGTGARRGGTRCAGAHGWAVRDAG